MLKLIVHPSQLLLNESVESMPQPFEASTVSPTKNSRSADRSVMSEKPLDVQVFKFGA